MYKLAYHPRAFKFLKKISKKEIKKILHKIEILQKDPNSKQIDIKKLQTTQRSYRLRVGKIRIIFSVDVKNKVIYIQRIRFRSSIYQ